MIWSIAQDLLRSRVDANQQDRVRGRTPLDRAHMSSDRVMINLIERPDGIK